jgi:hypothetical protein
VDVSTLHTLTEDLAAFLSEVTQSELKRPLLCSPGDVGDLYLRLIDQNVSVAGAVAGEAIPTGAWPDPMGRDSLEDVLDHYYGGGLEAGYRRTSRLMEDAFAAATDGSRRCQVEGSPGEIDVATLHELQITDAVVHTWDLAQALGLPYEPAADVTKRVLRSIVLRGARTDQDGFEDGDGAGALDAADMFACVLRLSGRRRPH